MVHGLGLELPPCGPKAMTLNRPANLQTERLHLRPFRKEDAETVAELCGAREIAETTARIPHPYDLSMAEAWIASQPAELKREEAVTFAIEHSQSGSLIGAIGLHFDRTNRLAEAGYWIGVPYWNQGYCTEALRAILAYGFGYWGMQRIQARHMTKNPSSGRVMVKAGMKLEGILRQSIYRWERYEDAAIYAVLREELTVEEPR